MKVSVLGAGLAAGLVVTGCKAPGKTKEPSRDVGSWTLAEIEAELQRNDAALANEGIRVAVATVPTAPVTTTPGDEQAGGEEQEDFETDSGGDAPELVEPEPAPEMFEPAHDDAPAPTSASPDRAYEAEEAVASKRGRGRRSSARRDAAPSRCERVCDLAEATCHLETQICELAQRHPDEPRYAQACERAEQQCEAASRACDRCED